MIERINDWLRERRIKRYSTYMQICYADGDKGLARAYGELMKAEIKARSPRQIARMESRQFRRVSNG